MENLVGMCPPSCPEIQLYFDQFLNRDDALLNRKKDLNEKRQRDHNYRAIQNARDFYKQGLISHIEFNITLDSVQAIIDDDVSKYGPHKYYSHDIVKAKVVNTCAFYDSMVGKYYTFVLVDSELNNYSFNISGWEVTIVNYSCSFIVELLNDFDKRTFARKYYHFQERINSQNAILTVVSIHGTKIRKIAAVQKIEKVYKDKERATQLQAKIENAWNRERLSRLLAEAKANNTHQRSESEATDKRKAQVQCKHELAIIQQKKALIAQRDMIKSYYSAVDEYPRFRFKDTVSDIDNHLNLLEMKALLAWCNKVSARDAVGEVGVVGTLSLVGGLIGAIAGPIGIWAGAAAMGYIAGKSTIDEAARWKKLVCEIEISINNFPESIRRYETILENSLNNISTD